MTRSGLVGTLICIGACFSKITVGVCQSVGYSLQEAQANTIYSQATYCLDNISGWNCAYCKNPLVSGFTSEPYIITNNTEDMHGFVGANVDSEKIIVAIRGTEDLRNWITNLNGVTKANFPLRNCQDPSNPANVHQGFFDAFSSIRNQIHNYLDILRDKYPSYSIVFTGHSLGAAIASLAALDFVCFSDPPLPQVTVYNYGSPRIGDQGFADLMNHQDTITLFRHVHWKDIVPHLPPYHILGYRHAATEYFLPETWTGEMPKACDGSGEDPTCSDQWSDPLLFSVNDHLSYFNFTMGVHGC